MNDPHQELFERVRRVFRRALDDNSLKITRETSQNDLLAWDSMFHVTLIMALEEEFRVRVSAREANELFSVPAILNYVQSKNSIPGRLSDSA